ncbi:MAG: class I SAM-dependent methyltransferase [Planctomycetes bacterium]|nr:class I SAM-dependent methyltransferase [Planctomycetota bacterium]
MFGEATRCSDVVRAHVAICFRKSVTRVTFHDHFSDAPDAYARHRPTYPDTVVDFLADLAPDHGRAWDLGCGSGQLSTLLARRFDHVLATDASQAQLDAAECHPKVEYRLAREAPDWIADASLDLVVAAQAAHWFDLDLLYREVRRVGKPGAAFVLLCYERPRVHDATASANLIEWLHRTRLAAYWPPERQLVEAGYRTLAFPFTEVEPPALEIERLWSVEDMLGYIETWSATRAARRVEGADALAEFEEDLRTAWGDIGLRVTWPIRMRAGTLDRER